MCFKVSSTLVNLVNIGDVMLIHKQLANASFGILLFFKET